MLTIKNKSLFYNDDYRFLSLKSLNKKEAESIRL
jgi:hypothetical protein